ncbi:hypothetical protein ACPCIY_05800 [Streptomyces thermodiastaticus]
MKLGKALATGFAQEEPGVALEQREQREQHGEQHGRERTGTGRAVRAAAEHVPHEAPSAR